MNIINFYEKEFLTRLEQKRKNKEKNSFDNKQQEIFNDKFNLIQPIVLFLSLIKDNEFQVKNSNNFLLNSWIENYNKVNFDFLFTESKEDVSPMITIFHPIEITIVIKIDDNNQHYFSCTQKINNCPMRFLIKESYVNADDLLKDLNELLTEYIIQ